MSGGIVGREAELAPIMAAIHAMSTAGAVSGTVGWSIRGVPGIGKSSVVGAVMSAAARLGVRVHRVSPAALERDLAWSALSLLVAGADSPPALRPYAQRQLTAIPDVATTVTELVAWFGRDPVVLVLDDAQWIDANSAAVLTALIRSLAAAVVVETTRTGERSALELSRLLGDDVTIVQLNGLSLAATGDLVNTVAAVRWDPGEVMQLHRLTDGHPMHIIELGRVAAPRDMHRPAFATIDSVFHSRLDDLPDSTRRLLAAAALTTNATITTLQRIDPRSDVDEPLAVAEQAGFITVSRDVVGFTHALARQAVLDRLGEIERRATHRRLAAVLDDPQLVLRHRAEAVAALDEELAVELQAAAAVASQQGSTTDALALIERAVRLSDCDTRTMTVRLVAAADIAVNAGNWRQASLWLHSAFDDSDDLDLLEPNAIQMVCADSRALGWAETEPTAEALFERLAGRPQAQAHLLMALVRLHQFRDLRLAEATAARSHAFASEHVVGNFSIAAEAALATVRLLRGNEIDVDGLLDLVSTWEGEFAANAASDFVGEILTGVGRFDEAVAHARYIADYGRTQGDLGAMVSGLNMQAAIAFTRGDWDEAERINAESADLSGGWANPTDALNILSSLQLSAARGEPVDALVRRVTSNIGDEATFAGAVELAALGFAALAADTPNEAATLFARAVADAETVGWALGVVTAYVDAVEAFCSTGRLGEATALNERIAAYPFTSSVPIRQADHALASGMIALAEHRHEQAVELLSEAVALHESIGALFAQGRGLLALADAQRLSRQRIAARQSADTAAAIFAKLGARPWERRCEALLARIAGGVAPTSSSEFTAGEQAIVDRVIAGRSNQEIADELFISLRTVESHLTKAYRKLGVKNRTGLVAAVRR